MNIAPEFLPPFLIDRRLLRAWREMGCGDLDVARIEVLHRKRKSTVYRLIGSRDGRPTLIAKRCQASTAGLERLVYQEVLVGLPVPSLRCLGCVPEADGDFFWLFLEDAGEQTYSPSSADHRALAARWLGTLHGLGAGADFEGLLPDRGARFYLQLLRTSRASLLARAHHPALSSAEVRVLRNLVRDLEEVEARWPEVEALLDSHPRALVHGDLVVKNLRIRPAAGGASLAVIDWETAGWGVPAADLAQFVGRCASPDLDTYASVVARTFPGTTASDIRRLAVIGALLRIVHKVYWETLSMVGDSHSDLATPLLSLTRYEPQFAQALHGLHREAA